MIAHATSRYYSTLDGLRLHMVDHSPGLDHGRPPLVCLPGLTRNADDFEPLAQALSGASATPRRVIVFDYRGRGLSDHDPDWLHYDLATERADILAGLALVGVNSAHFLGTSRGGLHIMGLATANRAIIRSAILNDIGPVLETAGLRRIKAYVGRPATPATIEDAVDLLKKGPGLHFQGLTEDEWLFFATATFGRDPAHLRLRYDLRLALTLESLDLTTPQSDMWKSFDALHGLPLLAVRGSNSDLLSAATHDAMAKRWPGCESHTVVGQGHAPLMADPASIVRIDRFLFAAEQRDSK